MEKQLKPEAEKGLRLLYGPDEIAARVRSLAKDIQKDFGEGKEFLCVCVLKGAFMFFSDLVKHLGSAAVCAFIRLSSYGDGTKTSGAVKTVWDLTEPAIGRDVLIVEDMVDSGLTLAYLKEYFTEKGAASVRAACLLDKPLARVNNQKPDYTAFVLQENRFVVGYGLDYAQKYRNLPGIYDASP